MMKKRIQKLPDSELDVMIALWNGHQEMTRSEIEDFMNQKKKLAPTTILTLLSRLEKKNFVSVKIQQMYGGILVFSWKIPYNQLADQ